MTTNIFITYDELREYGVPFTRVHLNRLINKGMFPIPVRLSSQRIAWRAADIAEWVANRPPARRVIVGDADAAA